MTLVISGTDRRESRTFQIATYCSEIIDNHGRDSTLLDLASLHPELFSESRYGLPSEALSKVLHSTILPADKIIIVAPEYNGSYPGILKYFIDLISPGLWLGKRVALVGVATGRAGNVRGLDHLTSVLHYLKVEVMSYKVYLSQLHHHSDLEGILVNEEYKLQLNKLVKDLAAF